MKHKQDGFTIIELLVTLFVAAIFLIAGYQIYTTVIRTDGQTKAQVTAEGLATDYGAQYVASAPYPCVASQPLTDSPVTATGLSNVTVSVTISCPKSAPNNVASINVIVKYNSPQNQVSYSTWAYVQDVCGAGWVLVPGDSRFDTPNFCVMKYEAKNVNGQAISQAAGTPWVNISQNDAVTVSAAACPTCHLISEAEWMTLAANVLSVPSNWSGGAVGSGYIYNGHVNGNPSSALAASNNDADGLNGITGGTGSGAQYNNRRTLTLSNGEIIWDLAGNVHEWTNATIGAGQQPGVSTDSTYVWKEWSNSSMLWNGLPNLSRPSAISSQAATWTSSQGIGELFSNYTDSIPRVFARGGDYGDGGYGGVLELYTGSAPTSTASWIGFRVAKSVDSQPEQLAQPASCPTGFIPVPGDARFGTIGFCVMKYEAKNNGSGTAISTATGTPWVSISQTSALTTSAAACTSCHLMSEAEWMTIAANVMSVASNWSGGAVGSGYIYSGHNDNSPASVLAASTDDTQGYYGETNTGGNQRRTLTLTNGQVIWDFAGDAWEWTNMTIDPSQAPYASGSSASQFMQWNGTNVVMNGLQRISQPAAISAQAGSWSSVQGIGMLYSGTTDFNGNAYGGPLAFVRGGSYNNSGGDAGVLELAINTSPTGGGANIGFRVAK